ANGQMMMGHHLTVFVGIARNVTSEPIEFKEQSCGNWSVAGVTSWPHKVLEPGQKTEVYVAVKQREKTESATRRPSLLSGGM
ncbi:conjugal transfer protein TraK, partial [Vibrio parahaemolyticus]